MDRLKAERQFWLEELLRYEDWYRGGDPLHGQPWPFNEFREDAIRAWIKFHQEPLYLKELDLPADFFRRKLVFEIGCGPVSGGLVFKDIFLCGIEPLSLQYEEMGFDMRRFTVLPTEIEGMPDSLTGRGDAVISVNSLDHVHDIEKAAAGIHRVLRPDGGFIAIAVDYHPPRLCEPIELNDVRMKKLFPELAKVRQEGERALWRTPI